jgi:hypothetical protein
MVSSRPRDSTTRPRRLNALVDWLLAASLAAAVIVALAGIDFRLGGLSISSHSAWRVLGVTAVLLLVRWRLGLESVAAWLMRLALLTAICGSVATWFRFLLATIGGADSYGYVSASEMIAGGRLVDAAPIAGWLTASNPLAIASPLGWAPAPDGSGIVPTYPIGVALVMAVFRLIGGADAVFFVSPVTGVLTLWLVYRLAREWFDAETALLAAALAAWNPLFIAYAKQPMSDMPATMWIVLACVLAMRSSNATAFGAGLAAGAAIMTRPALIVAGAIIPLAAHRGTVPLVRAALATAGFSIGVIAQMVIQQQLFGSPLASGYGTAATVLSATHFTTNLGIFLRHGWYVVGPLWIAGLLLGVIGARPEPRWKPAAVFAAVTLPYLFWLPFDHWETLRFLLPGLVPLTVVAADGLMHIARWPRRPAVASAIVVGLLGITVWQSESLLRASSVWDVALIEARYPLAGDWINVNTPPDSVVLANQHSGSLRRYGRRQTLRWDLIAPDQLLTIVRDLQSRGVTVYVALEGDEVAMFDQRFNGVIDQLQVDHVGRVRNVSFRRLR